MSNPLDEARFRDLQLQAEAALRDRPDEMDKVQRELDGAIAALEPLVLKARTQPRRPGEDPEPAPEAQTAQMQLTILRSCRQRIVNRRPSEAIRELIEVAEAARQLHKTSTALDGVRAEAATRIADLKSHLAETQDPAKPNTQWVNRTATAAFLRTEIARIEQLIGAIP